MTDSKNQWVPDTNGIYISTKNTATISYPDDGNDSCFAVEDSSDWFKYRNELILTFINKYKIKGDFLDIGGGNGFQVNAISESKTVDGKVIMIEPGYKGCLNAKNRKCENIYCGIFQDFDFDKNKIHNVGLFDVIEHIEDDIQFLNDLFNLLPNHSRVFINVPAREKYWSQVDAMAGHFRRYENNDITRIQNKTPFNVIDSTYYFHFYILPLLLLRILPEKLGFKKSKNQLLESEKRNLTATSNKGLLNSIFRWIHNVSLSKIKNGNRFKNGTSLFLILEKS